MLDYLSHLDILDDYGQFVLYLQMLLARLDKVVRVEFRL
jgi:hypothetical protein